MPSFCKQPICLWSYASLRTVQYWDRHFMHVCMLSSRSATLRLSIGNPVVTSSCASLHGVSLVHDLGVFMLCRRSTIQCTFACYPYGPPWLHTSLSLPARLHKCVQCRYLPDSVHDSVKVTPMSCQMQLPTICPYDIIIIITTNAVCDIVIIIVLDRCEREITIRAIM